MKIFKQILFLLFLTLSATKINAMYNEKTKKFKRKINFLPIQTIEYLRKISERKEEEDSSRPPTPIEKNYSEPNTPVTEKYFEELAEFLKTLSLLESPNETNEEEFHRIKRKKILPPKKRNKRFKQQNEENGYFADDEEE